MMKVSLVIILSFLFVSNALANNIIDSITKCHDSKTIWKENYIEVKPMDGTEGISRCLTVDDIKEDMVCMVGPIDKDEMLYKLSYIVNGSEVLNWTSPSMPMWALFALESIDLDGDNNKELIVTVLRTVSNGIAISYENLYVLRDKKLIGPFALESYGSLSGLYRLPDMKGCVLLSSKWVGGSEPGRGDGMYVEGEWYILKNDVFEKVNTLPKVKRRYLYRFKAEQGSNDQPLLWFKDKTTKIIEN
jgi:hypothetical protein